MKLDGLLKLQENSIVDWKDEIKRLESKIENGERQLNELKDKVRTVLGYAQNSSEKDLLDTKFGVTEKTRARSKHPFRKLGDGVENNPDNGSGKVVSDLCGVLNLKLNKCIDWFIVFIK